MKLNFDWKDIRNEKPNENALIIMPYHNGNLIVGTFQAEAKIAKTAKKYYVLGKQLRIAEIGVGTSKGTKTLVLDKQLMYDLYFEWSREHWTKDDYEPNTLWDYFKL
jgi:hypothetical protein